jgi:EPS-associated MarR family transcriptional regulator
MNTAFDTETRLKLLKLLQKQSQLTQREMTQKMGVSLGKINYCISELSQKGMIKVERFKKSKNKSAYMYRLTPSGLEEVTTLTLSFLKNKIREYDLIKMEIKSLAEQVREMDSEFADDPDVLDALKNKS